MYKHMERLRFVLPLLQACSLTFQLPPLLSSPIVQTVAQPNTTTPTTPLAPSVLLCCVAFHTFPLSSSLFCSSLSAVAEMGGLFSSSPSRSTGEDVQANVLWSLDESAFWEGECTLMKSLLSQAMATASSPEEMAVAAKLSLPSLQPPPALDRPDNVRPHTVPTLDQQCRAILNRMDLSAGDDRDHQWRASYPLSDPVHAHLARRAFAAAATQHLPDSINTINTVNQAVVEPQLPSTSAAEAEQELVVTVVEGPFDSRNTGTAAPDAVDVADLTSISPASFGSARMVQQARVELAAKFFFISALMDRLVLSAAHCYRLRRRSDPRQLSRPPSSLTRTMEPKPLPAEGSDHDEAVHGGLQSSLLHFDRAKLAVQWLRRDYELSYATYRISELSMWVKDARNDLQYDINSLPATVSHSHGGDRMPECHQLNGNDANIRILDELLPLLQRRLAAVEVAVQKNEKNSLDVALDYLDQNGDGRVTADDCTPQLAQLLFPAMTGRHEMYVTRDSMRAGLLTLSAAISRSSALMDKLTALGLQLTPKQKIELAKTTDDFHATRRQLRSTHQGLHHTFVDHLFSELHEDITEEAVHIAQLRRDLLDMESRAVADFDPLNLHRGQIIATPPQSIIA